MEKKYVLCWEIGVDSGEGDLLTFSEIEPSLSFCLNLTGSLAEGLYWIEEIKPDGTREEVGDSSLFKIFCGLAAQYGMIRVEGYITGVVTLTPPLI